jgi:predicted RNA methylase
MHLYVNIQFEGKVVLELGCGPGLVSLAAGVAGEEPAGLAMELLIESSM